MTASPKEHDRLYSSWQDHLAKVKQQLYRGFLHQQLWSDMRAEIERAQPDADATFLVSYTQQHLSSQMSLIRRLADTDPRSQSLTNLIQLISKNPGVITRTRFVSGYEGRLGPDGRGIGSKTWLRYYSDPDDPESLCTLILQADLDHLASGLEHITTWATKTIAHLDRLPPPRVPLYREIPEALVLLAEVAGHYEDLLTQSVTSDWNVIIQGDWQEPFRSGLFTVEDPQA